MMEQLPEIKRSTLTTIEIATYLGISQDLIFKMVRQKEIPHFRIGRRILFKKEAIEKWIEERMESGVV